jgi:hypothetical protein
MFLGKCWSFGRFLVYFGYFILSEGISIILEDLGYFDYFSSFVGILVILKVHRYFGHFGDL